MKIKEEDIEVYDKCVIIPKIKDGRLKDKKLTEIEEGLREEGFNVEWANTDDMDKLVIAFREYVYYEEANNRVKESVVKVLNKVL